MSKLIPVFYYVQVQLWQGSELSTDHWGCKYKHRNSLELISTTDVVEPEAILNLIFRQYIFCLAVGTDEEAEKPE